jgi:hypothetical protein
MRSTLRRLHPLARVVLSELRVPKPALSRNWLPREAASQDGSLTGHHLGGHVTDLREDLLRVERDGWQAISTHRGAEFYSARLTEDALMVLPGDMVLDRRSALDSLDGPVTWEWFRIENDRVVPLGDEAAALTYRVTAKRPDEEPYSALITSTYVRQGDSWLMAVHQQTPC